MKSCPVCHDKPLPPAKLCTQQIGKVPQASCLSRPVMVQCGRCMQRYDSNTPHTCPATKDPRDWTERFKENSRREWEAKQQRIATIRRRAKRIHKIHTRKTKPQRAAKIIRFIAGTTVFAALIAAPFNDFDYAYYQILRWIVTAWFAYKLFSQWTTLNIFFKTAFVLAIVTFNPLAPFHLDRGIWAANDIAAACLIAVAGIWNKTNRWITRILLIIIILSIGTALTMSAGELNTASSGERRSYRRISRPFRQRPSRRNEHRFILSAFSFIRIFSP